MTGASPTTIAILSTEGQKIIATTPTASIPPKLSFALRATKNFMNDTVHLTSLVILRGWNAADGSILRFDVRYDVGDVLSLGAGLLLYDSGDLPPLDTWAKNDRIFFNAKRSF